VCSSGKLQLQAEYSLLTFNLGYDTFHCFSSTALFFIQEDSGFSKSLRVVYKSTPDSVTTQQRLVA
jgi:hypothetical protein